MLVSTRWPDGYKHEVAALTKEQWEALQPTPRRVLARPAGAGQGSQGERAGAPAGRTFFWASGGLSVREKADRNPVVWLCEKKKGTKARQLCMVHIYKFIAKEHAVELMIQLGKEIDTSAPTVAGTSKHDIYARRNELFKQYCHKHNRDRKDCSEQLHWERW